MPKTDMLKVLKTYPPFDMLPPHLHDVITKAASWQSFPAEQTAIHAGAPLPGIYLITHGHVEYRGSDHIALSVLGPGDIMGERGIMRSGNAVCDGYALEDLTTLLIPLDVIQSLFDAEPAFANFFKARSTDGGADGATLPAMHVQEFMNDDPAVAGPEADVQEIAIKMREKHSTCVMIVQNDRLAGIVTARDLTNRVLAEARPLSTQAREVMTLAPFTIEPSALGIDAITLMAEKDFGHLPVAQNGILKGVVTNTEVLRGQSISTSHMLSDIAHMDTAEDMAVVVAKIPQLLAQMAGAGTAPQVITRLITDLADAVTRRLLALAEVAFGPPPVPYLWLACGSQGRQEQTGVSDQDNCLILSDEFRPLEHDAYFTRLAKFVSDGLDVCGYFYCPGDMMATAERWRQPVKVWRRYFENWINKPDNEAQMLASVMFDLRPISGDTSLFDGLQSDVLSMARENSIFVSHMISNSLKHTPPLGLFRGVALIRSGEHKNTLDLKHNGVVPVVDLGRVYALKGGLTEVNTRARLIEARDRGVISQTGAADLIDAFDFISEIRLRHQARQVRRGDKPDNFMSPDSLSDLERNHMRDAFVVIKTMQSAVSQGRGVLS